MSKTKGKVMIAYLLISALVFQCLGIVWPPKDIPHLVIKCVFLLLCIWGWTVALLEMVSILQNNPIY